MLVDVRPGVGRASRLILAVAAFCTFFAAASGVCAETQVFSLFDFAFEDGTVLPEVKIAYDTRGTLSSGKDNAILLLHDEYADRHAFADMVAPGKTFDTNKYFVITADALGTGDSSSPAEGKGQDFPRYTIRDMMAAQFALVTRGLGIGRLRALVGRSAGGFVALEWAIHHPESVQTLALIASAPKTDANLQVVIDLQVSAIALDPEWDGGRYTRNPVEGLRHAGMIYYPWAVSSAYLDRLPPRERDREIDATARNFAQWDANSLVLRLAACRAHDVSAPFGGDLAAALAHATMPVLVLSSASDRLIGAGGLRRLRGGLPHATVAEIASDLGHRAATAPPSTPEGAFVDRTIRAFLAGAGGRPRGE